MRIWRLISGAVSCIMFCYIVSEAIRIGMVNFAKGSSSHSGTTSFIIGTFNLIAGIMSIVKRRGGKESNIVIFTLYLLSALFALFGDTGGSDSSIPLYGLWWIVCALVSFSALIDGYGVPGFPKSGRSLPALVGFIIFCAIFLLLFGWFVYLIVSGSMQNRNPTAFIVLMQLTGSIAFILSGRALE